MWPAVPTTTWRRTALIAGAESWLRGGDDRLHEDGHLRGQDGAAVEEEPVLDEATDHRRIADTQRGVERRRGGGGGAARDAGRRQFHRRQCTAAVLRTILVHARGEPPRRVRAEPAQHTAGAGGDRRERLGEQAERGDGLARGAGLVGGERRLEGRDGELVDAQRAVPRVLLEPRDDRAFADDDPGLRAAEQLVARERHEVDSGGDDLGHGRLVGKAPRPQVDQRAGAQILHDRNAALTAELDQLAARHVRGEADHAVVRGVNLQQQRGGRADGFGVVAQVRAVGGTDLAQDGAAAQHDVRNAELAADLDQLAARDDDFFAVRERLEGQQYGRGVVVDDQRVLGGRQPSVREPGQGRIGGHTAHELVDGRQAAERSGAVSAH